MTLARPCRCALPALLLWAAARMACAAGWPDLPLPAGVQLVDVGDAVRINGLPMQVRGFLSPQPVAHLAAWFRASLGSPLVSNEQGARIILGQLRNGYYLTVQLDAAGSGTRGLVAQADVPAMMAGRVSPPADDTYWQSRLPAGTRILSLVQSRDGPRQVHHVVLQSRASLAESGSALSRMLGKDGYTPAHGATSASPQGIVLHFQGPGRDAMAVLTHDGHGMTNTVLSTSALAESAR